MNSGNERTAELKRSTRETTISTAINLDGNRSIDIATGLGFFDHMLSTLAFHANWDLKLHAKGDLKIDDHHTIEDCGLVLGSVLSAAVGDKIGIARFGSAYAPLDESLARAVVDISGRSTAVVDLGFHREMIGEVATENLHHFFRSLVANSRITLHLDVLRGENDHHRAEAAFKATALALRSALARDESAIVPSTKGVL